MVKHSWYYVVRDEEKPPNGELEQVQYYNRHYGATTTVRGLRPPIASSSTISQKIKKNNRKNNRYIRSLIIIHSSYLTYLYI